jgi:hypothetical protein
MNIYISHSSGYDYENEVYKPLKESELATMHKFFLPHEPQNIHTDAKTELKHTDVLVAEASLPSTGQGIELAQAEAASVPIVCFFKTGSKPSGSLRFVTDKIIEYSDISDLLTKLQLELNSMVSTSEETNNLDDGPFYHGTKADLQVGDLLTAGFKSNYKPEVTMNHIYFTALVNGAGLAAELPKGDEPARVYIVEPVGQFENDPNVTDKKFPGNPTRSYRSQEPLKVVGEITDWVKLAPEQLQEWRDKLANVKGEIVN